MLITVNKELGPQSCPLYLWGSNEVVLSPQIVCLISQLEQFVISRFSLPFPMQRSAHTDMKDEYLYHAFSTYCRSTPGIVLFDKVGLLRTYKYMYEWAKNTYKVILKSHLVIIPCS